MEEHDDTGPLPSARARAPRLPAGADGTAPSDCELGWSRLPTNAMRTIGRLLAHACPVSLLLMREVAKGTMDAVESEVFVVRMGPLSPWRTDDTRVTYVALYRSGSPLGGAETICEAAWSGARAVGKSGSDRGIGSEGRIDGTS